ncbi:type IV secretion system protein, partial [Kingella kingae]|uniref:type IV secretion system protein n=1 Tax=Kingella kingae TaxID=504 RepID=UPI00254C161D
MKIKMKVGVLLVATAIGLSPVVNAGGIPTFDGVQKATALKQLQEAVTTVKHLESQINQMKQQYAAITGSRNFGEILTNTGLKSALPQDWQKVYDSIQNGGYKGLDGTAKALADTSRLLDKCKNYKEGSQQQKTCQTSAVQSAQTQSDLMKVMTNAENRLNNLKQLASK